MNRHLIYLVRRLVKLYPSVTSIYPVVAAVRMRSDAIQFEKSAFRRWHYLVNECNKKGLIPSLLETVLADHPNDRELLELRSILLPIVAVPQYDLSRVIPPTPTGKQLTRIIGGILTASFPDCCAVGDDHRYYCSGTLISPRRVVTAKHCAEAPVTRVFLGGYDIDNPADSEIVAVSSMILHPTADIMLLMLSEAAKTAPRPLALSEEIDSLTPLACTLVGFGTIDTEGTVGYGIKRRVETPVVSLLCGGADAADFGCQQGFEMVAGHRGLDRDTCQGDSGGPLYVQYEDGSFKLLGVTSRGIIDARNCGDGGIYVRVDKFADWLKENGCG